MSDEMFWSGVPYQVGVPRRQRGFTWSGDRTRLRGVSHPSSGSRRCNARASPSALSSSSDPAFGNSCERFKMKPEEEQAMSDDKPYDWTIMVYLSGDNNLSPEMIWALTEIGKEGEHLP